MANLSIHDHSEKYHFRDVSESFRDKKIFLPEIRKKNQRAEILELFCASEPIYSLSYFCEKSSWKIAKLEICFQVLVLVKGCWVGVFRSNIKLPDFSATYPLLISKRSAKTEYLVKNLENRTFFGKNDHSVGLKTLQSQAKRQNNNDVFKNSFRRENNYFCNFNFWK